MWSINKVIRNTAVMNDCVRWHPIGYVGLSRIVSEVYIFPLSCTEVVFCYYFKDDVTSPLLTYFSMHRLDISNIPNNIFFSGMIRMPYFGHHAVKLLNMSTIWLRIFERKITAFQFDLTDESYFGVPGTCSIDFYWVLLNVGWCWWGDKLINFMFCSKIIFKPMNYSSHYRYTVTHRQCVT